MCTERSKRLFRARRMKALYVVVPLAVCVYFVWTSLTPGPAYSISERDKEEIIDSIVTLLASRYVYPEKSLQMDSLLKTNLANNTYAADSVLPDFTQSLTRDLREFSHDLHISIHPIPKHRFYATDDKGVPKEQIHARSLENFGWKSAEWLPGAVGYLKVDKFDDTAYAIGVAEAALSFMANCWAVIIDLRDNSGGQENMQQLIASYFFDEPTQLSSLYWTYLDSLVEAWTRTDVKGPSLARKDLYVLTSRHTASGAEAFAYNMKYLRKATIVGDTSAGAAHWSDWYEFPNLNVVALVPVARPINLVTMSNWEGTGVIPDIVIVAAKAKDRAYLEAVLTLESKTTDERIKRQLKWLVPTIEGRLHPVNLSDDLLSKYVGKYVYPDGERYCSVACENGNLYYISSGGTRDRLLPMSEHFFRLEKEHEEYGEIRVKFIPDELGEVAEMQWFDILGFMFKFTRVE
jgi:hypothetical protein